MNSFLTAAELLQVGFKKYGDNVLISRKASIYNPEKICIGDDVRIDDFCILSGKIVLGNHVHISAYTGLYARFGVEMENFSGLSPRCTVFSASDDFGGNYLIGPMVPEQYTNVTGGKVTIKRFTHVGAGSIIMPGVTLHEGVAVGAMSLVRKDLVAWSIYAGNPLRFIKKREKDLLGLYDRL
jgi:acetyltransferase-like isoleucine patch superfamily enzyme